MKTEFTSKSQTVTMTAINYQIQTSIVTITLNSSSSMITIFPNPEMPLSMRTMTKIMMEKV